jgi:hypothetical protein
MFENGLLNLTNWAGNVIMPTLAGLFFAAAIYHFSKSQPYSHLSWAGFAALMCSGLLRALEGFAQQAGASDPDRYWMAILTLVNWVGKPARPHLGRLHHRFNANQEAFKLRQQLFMLPAAALNRHLGGKAPVQVALGIFAGDPMMDARSPNEVHV